MNAELATIDGEVIEEQQPITLFGTTDPVAVVERASTAATALADVIRTRRLFKHIGTHDYVFVEGWTLLGSMLGVFAEVEWSRVMEGGWEARAVARTLGGRTVGAAEAMCTRTEPKWKTSDAYAIRSMAQTRAVSKALRLPLGFIMELAGYSATPAEELTADEQPGQGVGPSRRASADPVPAPAQYRRAELAALLAELHLGESVAGEYAKLYGVAPGTRASDEQMDQIIEAVRGHATGEELVIESAADVPAAVEPEAGGSPSPAPAPPKPRTPEYGALSAQEKAAARAYWTERDKEARQPEPMNPEPETLGLSS
jgi:hypothetical protein